MENTERITIQDKVKLGLEVTKEEISYLDRSDLIDLLYEKVESEFLYKQECERLRKIQELSLDEVLEDSNIRIFENPNELIVYNSIGSSEPHCDGKIISIDLSEEEVVKLLRFEEFDNNCPKRIEFIKNCAKERLKVSHHRINLDK